MMPLGKRWMGRVWLGLFFLGILVVPGYSYHNAPQGEEELGPHRLMNYYALLAFLEEASRHLLFERYDFVGGGELSGTRVVKPGSWKVEEGEGRGKWYQWVIEGGYTADEPESYMALRHFYDPLGVNNRAHYLTDHVDEFLGRLVMGRNPRMDAKWWGALHSPYSLSKGLEFMSSAFSSPHRGDKERLFAAAWRSLGETMHLLADMTVPAHVRNDSHPGVTSGKYKADPYEEYVGEKVVESSLGEVDPLFLAQLKAIPEEEVGFLKVLALFEIVASYTNRYYFSLDTVAGREKRSGIRVTNQNKMPEYPSPRLEDLEVDEEGYYYRDDALGRVYLVRLLFEKGSLSPPLLDEKCLESQAKRLIPIAIAVNKKLVEWFLPRIEVTLERVTTEKNASGEIIAKVKGKVVHTPSGLYDERMYLTLPEDETVLMIIDRNSFEPLPGSLSIRKGVIEGTVPLLEEGGEKVELLVPVGGLMIASSPLRPYTLTFLSLPREGKVGENLVFHLKASHTFPQVKYQWDFGDGSGEITQEPSGHHGYQKEGRYRITVKMQEVSTGETVATTWGEIDVSLQEKDQEGYLPPLTFEPTPSPLSETPAPQETPQEDRRTRVLAEYRSLYPRYLSWFHQFGRVELIANAEEIGPDLYRCAYKLWQVIEDGPRKGEEYVALDFERNLSLGQLEADLVIMKKNLGIEDSSR